VNLKNLASPPESPDGTSVATPVPIPVLTDAVEVAIRDGGCARRADDRVTCWPNWADPLRFDDVTF
jgi:hypothetical protein